MLYLAVWEEPKALCQEPDSSRMVVDMRTAVCVTGEARAFRIAAVRASLRHFLESVQTVALDMAIARYTSACGLSLSRGRGREYHSCAVATSQGFHLEESVLRAEFSHGSWRRQMRVELFNTSTCSNGRHENETCCHQQNRTTIWQPSAYLQYKELAQCALRLAATAAAAPLHERATHLIRTRPDTLYLDLKSSFRLERLAGFTRPTMVRKAQAGSPFVAARRGKSAVEASQPGDWFMIVPLAEVATFFTELVAPLESACTRGVWQGMRSPTSATPEAWLLATRVQCNQTSGGCSGVRWFAPSGYHNVHFRGVECTRRPPSLGERCLADFALATLSIGSTSWCTRLNSSALCKQRALAALNESYQSNDQEQDADSLAAAAAAPFEPTPATASRP